MSLIVYYEVPAEDIKSEEVKRKFETFIRNNHIVLQQQRN